MAYGCSVEQYLTNMSANGEFGEAIFIMAACLVLGISITVFTSNSHNGASSITSQTFSPLHPTVKTIQIHLDTGDSQLLPVDDPQTGLPPNERIITRQPHYDTLVREDRRDSGIGLQRKQPPTDEESSDLPLGALKPLVSTSMPLSSPPLPPTASAVPVPSLSEVTRPITTTSNDAEGQYKYFVTGTFDRRGRKGKEILPDAAPDVPAKLFFIAPSFRGAQVDAIIENGAVVRFTGKVPSWATVLELRKTVVTNNGKRSGRIPMPRPCTGFGVNVQLPRHRHKIPCPYDMVMSMNTAVYSVGKYTWCLGCDALRTDCVVNTVTAQLKRTDPWAFLKSAADNWRNNKCHAFSQVLLPTSYSCSCGSSSFRYSFP
ncbi:hypothetical protein BDR26DRAFT_120499 [Obelidium mucronatum]|nr:hypothetical protein BDR26DRAFT_120499 [Obelidium mucronatum]